MRKHSPTPRRASGLAIALATAAALLGCLSLTAAAPAAPHAQKHKKTKAGKASVPLSGIYDSCYFGQQPILLSDCGDRLRVLHDGGFQVVLNYSNAGESIADQLRYADEAQSLGMKVIWNLAAYKDPNTDAAVPIEPKLDLVRATMDHPGTWGYYIGDEHPEYLPQVAELARAIRALTKRPLLYVSRPNPSKLRPFKRLANYIGPDIYPVGPMDRRSVCSTARWASKMVTGNLTMVLQAYSWSIDFPALDPRWPTGTQMRQMRNQATRCGDPKLLMWFCFHCITQYNPNPDSYWRELAWAANGVSLGPNYRMAS